MARGSRYKSERLVGPATMENLSWIDIAKARMHTEEVVPAVRLVIPVGAPSGAGVTDILFSSVFGAPPKEGDIARIVNANPVSGTQSNGIAVQFLGPTELAGGHQMTVLANTTRLIVVPPGANGFRIISGSDSGINRGSHTLLLIEMILDN